MHMLDSLIITPVNPYKSHFAFITYIFTLLCVWYIVPFMDYSRVCTRYKELSFLFEVVISHSSKFDVLFSIAIFIMKLERVIEKCND